MELSFPVQTNWLSKTEGKKVKHWMIRHKSDLRRDQISLSLFNRKYCFIPSNNASSVGYFVQFNRILCNIINIFITILTHNKSVLCCMYIFCLKVFRILCPDIFKNISLILLVLILILLVNIFLNYLHYQYKRNVFLIMQCIFFFFQCNNQMYVLKRILSKIQFFRVIKGIDNINFCFSN